MEKVKLKRKVALALVLVISILLGLFQINPLKVEATESIESIEIVEAPTEFTAGELIDRSEILVKVNYVTGLSEEITNYKIKYVDKYVPKGLKVLIVEYMGFSDSKGVTVHDPIEDIGIDSEGNPVDLSLWKYIYISEHPKGPGYYEIYNGLTPLYRDEPAYIGEIVDGAIIGNVPAYINGMPVKGMNYAFSGLNNLTVIPEIPETVVSMKGTFKNTNITGTFKVSSNLRIVDDIFLGTTLPITVENKEDYIHPMFAGGHTTELVDKLKSIRLINLNDFKIGTTLSLECMYIEVEYESGYTRISRGSELNLFTFQLEGNDENIEIKLKVHDIGKTLTLKYNLYFSIGELINEVIIEDLDVFGIEISGVNKIPFSIGETVQNSDLSVTDIVFGDNIESFNIVYPTSALTLDDTYIEVEFQGYKATANINVEEETIPEPTLGEVIVSYTDTNFAHIKNQDIYYYPIGEEITINAPEIEGYKIAEGSSSQVVIPDELNTAYVYFTYEEITETGTGTGTVTIQYYDLTNETYPYTTVVEMEAGDHSIYATDIPEGYRIISWETNPYNITLNEGASQTITFYIEQIVGVVNIEKWVDNSYIYWNDTIQLPVGTQTINANDYFTDSSYVLVGSDSQTVEILDNQTTTVRFDYETAPEGFINLVVRTEDGQEIYGTEFSRTIGEQTIDLNECWGNPLYEVVGSSQKVVEVIEGNTTTVEFTVRKLATGYVNKIAKYNGEILGQYEEELPTGLQDVYAPWVDNLYEASESVKQVEIGEGTTVDVVFNYIKQPSYFVNHIGKYNEVVLYSTTQEKSLNDTWVSQWEGIENVETFNEEIYDLQGDSMKQVAPIENDTIEVVWNYTKAETGWVKIIGYDESMNVIYEETKEVRLDTEYVYAPYIDTGNPDTWYQAKEKEKEVIPSSDLMTAPIIEFYYTLYSENEGDGGTKPEDPLETTLEDWVGAGNTAESWIDAGNTVDDYIANGGTADSWGNTTGSLGTYLWGLGGGSSSLWTTYGGTASSWGSYGGTSTDWALLGGTAGSWGDAGGSIEEYKAEVPEKPEKDKDRVDVFVEDSKVGFPDTQPVVSNENILVPVRFVMEQLGFEVNWDELNKKAVMRLIEIDGNKLEIEMKPNQSSMLVNGKEYPLQSSILAVAPGRLMLPGGELTKAMQDIFYKQEKPSETVYEGYYYLENIAGTEPKLTDIPVITEFKDNPNLVVLTPENEETVLSDEVSMTDILLTAEPTNFRATVPFKVEIYMDKYGVITVGEGYKIINECPLGQIVIVNFDITPANEWVLVDISENFKIKKLNTKEFGLSVNESIALDNKVPLNTSLSEPIRNGESKDLVFDTELVGQTAEVNQVISSLSIVLDFWK